MQARCLAERPQVGFVRCFLRVRFGLCGVGRLPGPLCASYQEASVIVLSLHCDVNFKHLVKVVTASFSSGQLLFFPL